MRVTLASACLLLAVSALPAVARPDCRRVDPSSGRVLRCDPYRPVGERDPGLLRETPPRPRPWALPRGRDSLPMPGPF